MLQRWGVGDRYWAGRCERVACACVGPTYRSTPRRAVASVHKVRTSSKRDGAGHGHQTTPADGEPTITTAHSSPSEVPQRTSARVGCVHQPPLSQRNSHPPTQPHDRYKPVTYPTLRAAHDATLLRPDMAFGPLRHQEAGGSACIRFHHTSHRRMDPHASVLALARVSLRVRGALVNVPDTLDRP